MMKLTYCSISILALTILISSCTNNSKPKANPTIPPKYIKSEPTFKKQAELIFIDKANDTISKIDIELADTEAKIEMGLMHRRSMKEKQGMLFIFNDEARRSFWMKNTHIPLDIIFINEDHEIVHIAQNTKPYSLNSIPSIEYAQYVVEVNAGYCDRNNIKSGHFINF